MTAVELGARELGVGAAGAWQIWSSGTVGHALTPSPPRVVNNTARFNICSLNLSGAFDYFYDIPCDTDLFNRPFNRAFAAARAVGVLPVVASGVGPCSAACKQLACCTCLTRLWLGCVLPPGCLLTNC